MGYSGVVTGVLCQALTATHAPWEQVQPQLEETVLPSDVDVQLGKRNWAEQSQQRVTLNQLGLLAQPSHWCRAEPCLPQCLMWLCVLVLHWRTQPEPSLASYQFNFSPCGCCWSADADMMAKPLLQTLCFGGLVSS